MTEGEWLACRWPRVMLEYLTGTPGLIYKIRVQQHPRGRRKLRLFGVAVARRVIHLVSNPDLHQLLDAAEAFADGFGTVEALEKLRIKGGVHSFMGVDDNAGEERYRYLLTRTTRQELAAQAVGTLDARDAYSAAYMHNNAALALEGENIEVETARQCQFVRDIFGNPFRPVAFDAAWRTSTATALARQMYESRDFGAMPILADALQDAGCTSDDVLSHCRDPLATHVRGCWVVDLVLGKS